MDFFSLENGVIRLNKIDILLIKEFKQLIDLKRNKTKQDPTGQQLTKAFKEFHYIKLAIDWESPYRNYPEMERHELSLIDSEMTEEEFNDDLFREACRKYIDIQETRETKLLRAVYVQIEKMRIYFETLDPFERDDSGKPIFKMKDLQAEITGLSKLIEGLRSLEEQVRSGMISKSKIRGDETEGIFD